MKIHQISRRIPALSDNRSKPHLPMMLHKLGGDFIVFRISERSRAVREIGYMRQRYLKRRDLEQLRGTLIVELAFFEIRMVGFVQRN